MSPLLVGIVIGLVVAAVTWLLIQRSQQGQLATERERRITAESNVTSLRQQLSETQTELQTNRSTLKEESAQRAAAEAKLSEAQAAENRLVNTFKALSADALNSNNQSFLQLARETLQGVVTDAKGDLGKRQEAIKGMVKPLEDALGRYEKLIQGFESDRENKYGQLKNELGLFAQGTDKLQNTVAGLAAVLGNSRIRGQWGQKIAEDILRACGLKEGVHYRKEQTVGTGRPDYTFFLPEKHQLFMDVKFPYENCMKAIQAEGREEQDRAREQFMQDVRKHLKDMEGRDYQGQADQAVDYILIFIANEQVYGLANEWMPGLIDQCLEKKMILCGPWTLYALVRIIWQAWQNYNYTLAIQDIVKAINAFQQYFKNFKERFKKLGEAINKANTMYEEITDTSYKRLDRKIRHIEEYRKGQRIPEAPVEPEIMSLEHIVSEEAE